MAFRFTRVVRCDAGTMPNRHKGHQHVRCTCRMVGIFLTDVKCTHSIDEHFRNSRRKKEKGTGASNGLTIPLNNDLSIKSIIQIMTLFHFRYRCSYSLAVTGKLYDIPSDLKPAISEKSLIQIMRKKKMANMNRHSNIRIVSVNLHGRQNE